MWRAIRPWLFPVWCAGCGVMDVGLCAACAAQAVPAALWAAGLAVDAAGAYAGPLREALLGVKRGERACLDPLAALLAARLSAGTTLVPVVTTRRRAAERGFDQARELAQRAALMRGVPVADVLRKRGGPQRGGNRVERLAARGRYVVRAGVALPAEVVLVDDVVTTGATLRDAAAALGRAGVAVLGAAVVAHAPLRETSRPGRESHEA